jgi:ribose/xylose/arabinose/galactoside ABC-type transport system permease subunit
VVRVNSFITTLGMLYLVQGITLQVSNSTAPNPLFTLPGYNIFEAFGADQVFNQVPVQIFWMAAIGLIMYFVIRRTKFGFRCAAIGGNPTAARIARLPVRSYKTICFVISGLFAVIGGLIDFSYVGTTQPTSGQQLPFEVFAAVILGGASLSGGRGTAIGTILGALFIALVNNGLSLIGYYASVQQIFLGAMIIIAVAIDVWTTGAKADGRAGNVLW